MRKYTDHEIIEDLKNRNGEAVRYLLKKFLPMIKYMGKDFKYSDGEIIIQAGEEDAEDVFQEALYIIIKRIDSGDLKLSSKFSTFFYAVCKNLLKRKLKSRIIKEKYKIEKESQEAEYEEPFISFEVDHRQQIFDFYFLKLSPVCKNILELAWKEKTNIEIAKILGYSVKYVAKRKYECKNRLIDLIKNNADNI